VCVAINTTREVFEISAFGGNRLYRIIYANVLYFIVIHGGPLLLIAFFNVKLIQALKHRQRRRAEMGKSWYQQGKSWYQQDVSREGKSCMVPAGQELVPAGRLLRTWARAGTSRARAGTSRTSPWYSSLSCACSSSVKRRPSSTTSWLPLRPHPDCLFEAESSLVRASASVLLTSIEFFGHLFHNARKTGVICRPHPA